MVLKAPKPQGLNINPRKQLPTYWLWIRLTTLLITVKDGDLRHWPVNGSHEVLRLLIRKNSRFITSSNYRSLGKENGWGDQPYFSWPVFQGVTQWKHLSPKIPHSHLFARSTLSSWFLPWGGRGGHNRRWGLMRTGYKMVPRELDSGDYKQPGKFGVDISFR